MVNLLNTWKGDLTQKSRKVLTFEPVVKTNTLTIHFVRLEDYKWLNAW